MTVQAGAVERWYAKGIPSPLEFDERFQYYTRTIVEVEGMPLVKDLYCIHLHMGPLADGIKKHARMWIEVFGERLHESASQYAASLHEQIVVSRRVRR